MFNHDSDLEARSVAAVLHLALIPCCKEGRERSGLRLTISSPVHNPLLVGGQPSKMYKPTHQNPQHNFLIGILRTVLRLKI